MNGIINNNNTCYLNTVLHTLFNTEIFNKTLININNKKIKGELILIYLYMLNNKNKNSNKTIKEIINKSTQIFTENEHHDAHELLLYIIAAVMR